MAQEYEAYMEEVALPAYADTPGNRGVLMLKRLSAEDRMEFVMVTLWDSMESLKAFAGDDHAWAVFHPEDDHFLVARHWEARHYELYGRTRTLGESA